MITHGTDPTLAALAREFFDRLDEVARLNAHMEALVKAGRRGTPGALDELHALDADGGPWDQSCGRLRAAESALLDALEARGLVGAVVGGRLYLDARSSYPDHSGHGETALAYDLARIVGLD